MTYRYNCSNLKNHALVNIEQLTEEGIWEDIGDVYVWDISVEIARQIKFMENKSVNKFRPIIEKMEVDKEILKKIRTE